MPALPNTTTQKLPEGPKRHPDPTDPAPVPPPRGSQESKHNKHNDPPQHQPRKHTPAEGKE
jgi:hypothetical protein